MHTIYWMAFLIAIDYTMVSNSLKPSVRHPGSAPLCVPLGGLGFGTLNP